MTLQPPLLPPSTSSIFSLASIGPILLGPWCEISTSKILWNTLIFKIFRLKSFWSILTSKKCWAIWPNLTGEKFEDVNLGLSKKIPLVSLYWFIIYWMFWGLGDSWHCQIILNSLGKKQFCQDGLHYYFYCAQRVSKIILVLHLRISKIILEVLPGGFPRHAGHYKRVINNSEPFSQHVLASTLDFYSFFLKHLDYVYLNWMSPKFCAG